MKIINMADRLKDEVDLRLESLFRSEPVTDDGFTMHIVSRVRRQMWVRRLSLPLAIAIGAVVSAKSVIQVVNALPDFLGSVPALQLSMDNLPISTLPDFSALVIGATVLGAALLIGQMLEE